MILLHCVSEGAIIFMMLLFCFDLRIIRSDFSSLLFSSPLLPSLLFSSPLVSSLFLSSPLLSSFLFPSLPLSFSSPLLSSLPLSSPTLSYPLTSCSSRHLFYLFYLSLKYAILFSMISFFKVFLLDNFPSLKWIKVLREETAKGWARPSLRPIRLIVLASNPYTYFSRVTFSSFFYPFSIVQNVILSHRKMYFGTNRLLIHFCFYYYGDGDNHDDCYYAL